MSLLEIILLIFITYSLLAAGRRKTRTQKQPAKPAPPQDPALEEALREIREALRLPETEEQRSGASAGATFHSLEQPRPIERQEARWSEFHSLESDATDTRWQPECISAPDEVAEKMPARARSHSRARFWLERLRQREGVREAIVLAELLGPPRARRPWRPRIGSDHLG